MCPSEVIRRVGVILSKVSNWYRVDTLAQHATPLRQPVSHQVLLFGLTIFTLCSLLFSICCFPILDSSVSLLLTPEHHIIELICVV